MIEFIYNKKTGIVISATHYRPTDSPSQLSKSEIERGLGIYRTESPQASLKTTVLNLSDEQEFAILPSTQARISVSIVPQNTEHIVFIRTHTSIGDLVSITSAIQSARKQRPRAKITVLAPKEPLAILENHPDIDELGEPSELANIEKEENVVFIDLSHPCPCGEYESAMRGDIDRSRNEIFTLASGFHWDKERPRLYLSEEEKKFGFEFTNRAEKKTRIGVCLRTAETWKDWPFVEDFISLLNSQDYEVYVFDKSQTIENAINVVGKSIREVMAILVYMDCVISFDTAIFHLCDALDVPCIALFGSLRADLHANKYPSCISYLQGKCQYGKPPCMYDICEGKGQFQKCMEFDPKFVFEKMRQKLFTGTITD